MNLCICISLLCFDRWARAFNYVHVVLQNLNSSKATGPDRASLHALKLCMKQQVYLLSPCHSLSVYLSVSLSVCLSLSLSLHFSTLS